MTPLLRHSRSLVRFSALPSTSAVSCGQRPGRALGLLSALVFTFAAVAASAQSYTSIVVFGDSLSDVGNVADLTQAKYGVRIPGPIADYTDGRFTDGTFTVPAALNFHGIWVEQLAAMLPSKPKIKASLDGGTDYAYGFAGTGKGTAPLALGTTGLSVTVNNIGQQITDYLATKPKITNKTLFVVWGGANDLLGATSTNDVVNAAINEASDVERLIQAGATQILVPNLPPLGLVPRLNGSPTTSVPATAATVLYNTTLRTALGIVQALNFFRRMNLYQLDVFKLFQKIVASPSSFLLTNVTAMSQGNYLVNPDTFLFWDDLHPTTRGHDILATAADVLLGGDGDEDDSH